MGFMQLKSAKVMVKKIIPIDEPKVRDFSWKQMSFPVEVISTKSDAGW
jgi:hypothetical protein